MRSFSEIFYEQKKVVDERLRLEKIERRKIKKENILERKRLEEEKQLKKLK